MSKLNLSSAPHESGVARPVSAIARPAGWWSWLSRGTLAIADQALNSGSNFLLSVLLARWLTLEEYGSYALGISILLLLASVHGSLLVDPMPVFGPSTYENHRSEYLGALLRLHAVAGAVFALVLAAAALIAHLLIWPMELVKTFIGLMFAVPCTLLLWIVRQAFYIQQTPRAAAIGSALYSGLLVAGMVILYQFAGLTSFGAFMITAVAAAGTSFFMLRVLKPVYSSQDTVPLSRVWRDHWSYGRWAWATSAARWIPGNVTYVLTGSVIGVAEIGALKALLNLLAPLGQTAVSFSRIFVPYLSAAFGRGGRKSTKTPVIKITSLFVIGGALYGALLVLFSRPILNFLYEGKFTEFAHLVLWVAIGGAITTVSYGPSLGLKAMQSPQSVFAVYGAAGVVSIVTTLVAVEGFGLGGVLFAFVMSSLTVLCGSIVLYVRKVNEPS